MEHTLKNLDYILTELRISLEKAACVNDMILDDASVSGEVHSYTEDTPHMILNDYLKQCKTEVDALDEISDILKQMQPQVEAK